MRYPVWFTGDDLVLLETKALIDQITLRGLCCIVICYNYICNYTHTHAEYILTQWIKTNEDFFKKYTSHFIWKGCVCERELESEQRLQHIDLPNPSRHSRVSFSFSWTAQPEAQRPTPLDTVFSTVSCH